MPKFNHINDTVHGLIELTKYEKHILGTAGFNRLHDVYQNSTVYLTFPTNRTKRFEHSLGTMKLASDMFLNSVKNTDEAVIKDILRIYKQAIEDVCIRNLEEDQAIIRGEKLPRGSQTIREIPAVNFDVPLHLLIPANVDPKYHDCFLVLLESVRIAALLHDVGHPPYSHIVESSMKEVYDEACGNNPPAYLAQYKKRLDPYFVDNGQLHEQMGMEISRSILLDVIPGKTHDEISAEEKIFRFIVRECVTCIYENRYPFKFLHDIVEGTLDADRLDYVTRDPRASGLDVGSIDYSRIFSNMRIHLDLEEELPSNMGLKEYSSESDDTPPPSEKDKEGWTGEPFFFGKTEIELGQKAPEYIKFCNPMKSLHSIEDFLSRRFDLYKNIILHHHVVKTDALLEGAVELMIKDYLMEHSGDLNGVDQYIASDISGLWFPLGKNITPDEKEDALSQWNDSWLMTCLKQHYYREILPNKQTSTSDVVKQNEKVLKRYLDELIYHERRYTSLIKRSGDFSELDKAVKEIVLGELERCKTQLGDDRYPESLKMILEQGPAESHGFFLAFFEPLYKQLCEELTRMVTTDDEEKTNSKSKKGNLRETISDVIKKFFNDENLNKSELAEYEYFVRFNKTKTGISEPVYFFTSTSAEKDDETKSETTDTNSGKKDKGDVVRSTVELREVSNIEEILTLQRNSCPYFFLYVYRDSGVLEKYESSHGMSKKLSNVLGEKIGDQICEEIDELIQAITSQSPIGEKVFKYLHKYYPHFAE